MKNTLKALILASLSVTAAKATVTLNGIAFLNAPSIAVGDVAYFIVDINNTGFSGISFDVGDNLGSASSYGDFFILGTKTATAGGANVLLSGAFSAVALANGVTTGDRFAAVVFSNSTTSALTADTFKVWSDPTWIIPADASLLSYQPTPTAPNFKQLGASATPVLSGTVLSSPIPEPSSFAAIAGLGILGFAASRRRRVA